MVEREAIAQIVRWIDQALERADKHGNTEGIWLLAKQWRLVRAALATQPVGEPEGWRKALLSLDFANTAPIEWSDFQWEQVAAALASPPTNDEDRSRG